MDAPGAADLDQLHVPSWHGHARISHAPFKSKYYIIHHESITMQLRVHTTCECAHPHAAMHMGFRSSMGCLHGLVWAGQQTLRTQAAQLRRLGKPDMKLQ